MTCEHYNVIHYSKHSQCKRCGEKWDKEPPKKRADFTDEDRARIARQFGDARSADWEPDLVEHGASKYRHDFRTGTGMQEEKKEKERIKKLRETSKVTKGGMRHGMSIPADVYHGARSKYGTDCWADKKFQKKFKMFNVNNE